MGNWDRWDEFEDVPFFTQEERKRVTKNFNMLQEKYDPVAAKMRKEGTFHFGRREDQYESGKKIRGAEAAAGWPRSSPY